MSTLYMATITELRAEAGIPDSNDDAELTRRALGLQGRFEDHCNRLFKREVGRVETHFYHRTIFLDLFPIEQITSVKVENVEVGSWALRSDRGVLRVDGNDPSDIVEVTYTGGYSAAGTQVGEFPMPEGLRRALFLQFGYEWRNKNQLGNASMGAQGVSVQLAPADLLPDVKAALSKYTRI